MVFSESSWGLRNVKPGFTKVAGNTSRGASGNELSRRQEVLCSVLRCVSVCFVFVVVAVKWHMSYNANMRSFIDSSMRLQYKNITSASLETVALKLSNSEFSFPFLQRRS